MKVGVKYYLIIDDRILKIGIDTKKVFPDLADKTVPAFQVIFERDNPSNILEIRIDPHHFNSCGKYETDEFTMKKAMHAIDKTIFAKYRNNDRVIEFQPQPYINNLTEAQKALIKDQFNKDFGPNAWENLLPSMKAAFWKTGMGRSW
jgi:hypothetical protein